MTQDTSPATPPLADPDTQPQGRPQQISVVARYLESNGARFTEESLLKAALDAGYPADVVEEARRRVRAAAPSAPAKRRARRWVLSAYALTFAVLVVGMSLNERNGSFVGLGIGVLTLALGLALLISLATLSSQGRAGDGPPVGIVALLVLPVILLVAVAGLCVMTGLPIPQTY